MIKRAESGQSFFRRWFLALLAALLLAEFGCRSSAPTQAALTERLREAILADDHQTYEAEVHIACYQPEGTQKKLLQVYKPHPDYARIIVVQGEKAGTITYLDKSQVIRLHPDQKRIVIEKQPEDAEYQQSKQRVESLFRDQVDLALLPEEVWNGQRCYVVEARVGDSFPKRYWLTGSDSLQLVRLQTLLPEGRVWREEQRLHYKPLTPLTTPPPSLPPLPRGWRQIVLPSPTIVPSEQRSEFTRVWLPKGYRLLYACRSHRCPCGCSHPATCGIYSNGLNTFTLFVMASNCKACEKVAANSTCHVKYTEAGLFAVYRTRRGRLLALVGEVSPEQAGKILSSF